MHQCGVRSETTPSFQVCAQASRAHRGLSQFFLVVLLAPSFHVYVQAGVREVYRMSRLQFVSVLFDRIGGY